MRRAFGAALVAAAVLLAGCGGGGGAVSRQSQQLGHIDINAQPRDKVRDGGTLRLPMDSFPSNFNYNEVDGTFADTADIAAATLPSLFRGTADGGVRLNTDYLTSATLTSTSPQVITYTINPKAVWSDGSPLTWRDLQAAWQAQNGTNPAYQATGTTGYDDIASVNRGSDDRQAVVTFRTPFSEWQGLFSPLYPAALTGTPAGFNTAYKTGLPLTSGPFTTASVDQTGQTVTLTRDPRWWGTPPKLDSVTFRVIDPQARPDALANNEIDYFEISADLDLLRRAQQTPGVVVRNAPSRVFWQVTFNGAAGSVLSDVRLRRAIAEAINRADIAQRQVGQIVPNPQVVGNHLYTPGSKQYQDNSAQLRYDPAQAQRELDALGWVRQGATRVKDGKPLSLRMVYFNAQSNLNVVKSVQNQLAQIGVTIVPQGLAGPQYDDAVTKGSFDLITFGWGSTPTPLSSAVTVYETPKGGNPAQNYGRISDPRIDSLINQGLAEFDDTKRAAIGNQIDVLIWQEVHDLPLYSRPGAVAVRSNLANFGAFGLADLDFVNAGFVK